MVKLSTEQQAAVDAIATGHNVIIKAVAGAGKTTTIFNSIKPGDGKCLLLTYNAQLKIDSRDSCEAFGVSTKQLYVHSYNSFGYAYVGTDCATDEGFLKPYVLRDRIPRWSRIYVDEVQDMTWIHYELLLKILERNPSAQIILVGDPRQMIYGFKGADHRYLTLGDKIFSSEIGADYADSSEIADASLVEKFRKWISLELHTSYRLTKQNASLMNAIIGDDIFHSDRAGPLPEYLFCSPYDLPQRIFDICKQSPSDTFILAYSTSGQKSPVKMIENKLVKMRVPTVVINDDTKGSSAVIANKCVVSTHHRTKGLGRKIVIIIGFDEMFYEMSKDDDRTFIPNILYVAMTRSAERLILVNAPNKKPFSWMERIVRRTITGGKMMKWEDTNAIVGDCLAVVGTMGEVSGPGVTVFEKPVAEFVKFLSFETLARLKEMIVTNIIRVPQYQLDIASVVGGAVGKVELAESIADITGIAIPAYLEYVYNGSMSIYTELRRIRYLDAIENYVQPEGLLKLATEYWSYRSGYKFKKAQISSYNWLTQEHLDIVSAYSNGMFDGKCEAKVSRDLDCGMRLVGSIDCLSPEFLYEYKCVGELSIEHFIQTLMYRYLLGCDRICLCANLLTGEIVEVCGDVDAIVRVICADKLIRPGPLSDDEFVAKTKDFKPREGVVVEDVDPYVDI